MILSDGKPGHFSLADGIVSALARSHQVEATRVEVRRPAWLFPRLLSQLVNRRVSGLEQTLGLSFERLQPAPAIVVSAGGDTLAANVLAARQFGARNIFYGSLRQYRPADFRLVLTSYARAGAAANTVTTLKPSARDPDRFPVVPAPNDRPVRVGILVGGDSGTVRYSNADWDRLVRFAENQNGRLQMTFANSRRTPAGISDRLGNEAAAGRIGFIDVRSAGPGTLDPLFANSEAILATVDSSSMISEAVWVRRPVAVLTPERWTLPEPEQRYRTWIEHQGWTTTVPLAATAEDTIVAALGKVTPLATNPLTDLATLLDERLFGGTEAST